MQLRGIVGISIHALREEGDTSTWAQPTSLSNFYPRPPRGGRPLDSWHYGDNYKISIHALREEGDISAALADGLTIISIHALREEGDLKHVKSFIPHTIFLSTPSARRATSMCTRCSKRPRNFYPRPPRGGRLRHSSKLQQDKGYFYPRPPRGGRPERLLSHTSATTFLSTPSARRATAGRFR